MNESAQKLYDLLVQQQLYNKSPEEFATQFSNPSSANKLHQLLVSKNLYDKSYAEFGGQFALSDGVEKTEQEVEGYTQNSSGNWMDASGEVVLWKDKPLRQAGGLR